jgi:hypothetical protein
MRPANRSYNRRSKLCAMQMEGIVSKSFAAPKPVGPRRSLAEDQMRATRGVSDRRLRGRVTGGSALSHCEGSFALLGHLTW